MGEAREGMDGEGIGIDVEEAILEVCLLTSQVTAERKIDQLTPATGKRRQRGGRYHGVLPHLRWSSSMLPSLPIPGSTVAARLTGVGSIPPICGVGSQRCRRTEPSIPLQPLSQVRPLSSLPLPYLYNTDDPRSVRFISPITLKAIPESVAPPNTKGTDEGPEGSVKSILPCTPLAIVKVLEHLGVYNKMLRYGDRARGKVITVINRYVTCRSLLCIDFRV